ncbi:MAG: hypothetical protein CMP39_04510 [Rickettsiales bacterium]|nr:hypothetical protein [Rickettsiales bacterium]
MISFYDNFFQDYIQVSSHCNYPCLKCRSTDNFTNSFEMLDKYITQGTFFNYYHKSRVFNIIGGDVFEYNHLLKLCRFLHLESIKIRLWINPSVNFDLLLAVLPFVDEIAINMPHIEEIYLDESLKLEKIKDLEAIIVFLNNENKTFFIHHLVTKDSISYLPNLYDYIYNLPHRYVLHYSPFGEHGLDKNDIAHTKYYQHLSNVFVFSNKQYLKNACNYIPVSLFSWKFKYLIYFLSLLWIRFKKKLNV